MKSNSHSFVSLLAVGFIIVCTSAAWAILGITLLFRTNHSQTSLDSIVKEGWGGPLTQLHPYAWYASPTGENGRKIITPESSNVTVHLTSEPRQKGLLWFRTYQTEFSADYQISNPTPIEQTLYVAFQLPNRANGCYDVSFVLGERNENVNPTADGQLTAGIIVPAGASTRLRIAYKIRGIDEWAYDFENGKRIQNFKLALFTSFREINFPVGTGSPTSSVQTPAGWKFEWNYPDVIGASAIGMTMPNVLNPGPVAARITFYAPVSLLFFSTVLLVLAIAGNTRFHPMNFFFISAGFFSFHLLFAYLVDVLPLHMSFLIAAIVSMILVCGYIHALAGNRLALAAAGAQLAYMVLFSYSFFIDGYSGLTITVGSILTLAFLMIATAKVDWSQRFSRRPQITPPPITA
ncbi:MAG: inner membrane CreD family protein [Verrucomicrobia bacterium]|nr:inner membrane CreD family protein [Verrucomicrobiota bacterium]